MTSSAIIYCRVSTAEQTKNLSLPTQRSACRAYCAQNRFRVVAEFIEEGESAKTADRPELQRMLEYCRKNRGRIDALVVYNVTRFSRDRLDHAILRAHLSQLGVAFRSVTEPIDETATGQLMEGILASFAQFENNQKAERTKAGMLTALAGGRWTFVAPLGYRNGGRGAPSLIVDPKDAPLVREAFEAVASGERSVARVKDLVTKLGLRSRSGRELSLQTVHKLLRNPLYAGRIAVARWNIDQRGDFEPIVSGETFDRAQAILNGRPELRVRHEAHNPAFPLRRFVRCDQCNAPLTGSFSKGRSARYGYYHCVQCGAVRVRSTTMEADFMSLLRMLQPSARYMQLFGAIVRDAWKQRQDSRARAAAIAGARVRELRDRLAALDEAFVFRKDIDRQSYLPMRDKYREQLALAEIAATDARVDELDVEAALAASDIILTNAAGLWQNASPQQRQRLQRALFPDGLTHDGKKFGTARTCIAFKGLQPNSRAHETVASPGGFEPPYSP